jgi:glucosamine-6-phosphate deaminase
MGSPGPGEASSATERIPTRIVEDADEIAVLLAQRTVEIIQREVAARGRCVLGLATGSTPLGIYRELTRRHRLGEVSFANVISFNLDEYYPMAPYSIHSYRQYMMENFFSGIDMDPRNIHIPDGAIPRDRVQDHCREYEERIRDVGGIDLQILGIGRSGHIGFNEPGSPPESRTRLITLDTITRRDAAADFFGEDNVPAEAITMGVATILDAKEIALIATGEHKAAIVRRAVEGNVTPEVTATYLQERDGVTVYLDLPAAGELTRVATPWLSGAVEWTPEAQERAVVWLAGRTGKAVLKLSAPDYRDNHLSSLLAGRSTPGELNGEVFNRLRDKVRGRSRLPSERRVVVFSPHPDDDVISMGGMLRKLWENGNAVTVAYMTSGNIAVFDHDLRRHLSFVQRAAPTLGLDPEHLRSVRHAIEAGLKGKQPGDVDSPESQALKRVIRESEAIAAIAVLGLPPSTGRFLNLPFYRTGEVRKRPVGDEDVEIVLSLLKEVAPELVFVAGDLSDPHGTHRMCKAAIERALALHDGPDPEVWLYRGAWEEWSLTEADVLVPLSEEELKRKIFAIFKHQSQKDVAPFPGGYDDREFWQRVEARNLETAARADLLGLPEYYAMEAYVIATPPRSRAAGSSPTGPE